MHKLYELKDMLCEELEKYGEKKELTAGSLDVIDKLAHAIKNIDKIIENGEEDEYSNTYMDGNMNGYRSYARTGRGRMSNRGGRSYAQRRDARGRYSSERGYSMASDEIAEELRDLMQDAPDNQTKMEIQRIVERLEQM